MTDKLDTHEKACFDIDNLSQRYESLTNTAMEVIKNYCHMDGKSINDQSIYDGLQRCLDIVGVEGVIIHFGENDLWLACFSLDRQAEGKLIVNYLKENSFLHQSVYTYHGIEVQGNAHTYIQNTIRNSDTCKHVNHQNNGECEPSLDDIFLLNPSPNLFGNLMSDSDLNLRWHLIFATLHEVFIRRNYAYRHFPPELPWHFWNQVSFSDDDTSIRGFFPPWSKKEEVRRGVSTITLSLDLRKSTIVMEQATNFDKFAEWMRGLIKELTEIAFTHQGVFDKFTGDGVIIHFLEDDVNRLIPLILPDCPQKTAIEQAVVCAARMVVAVDQRLAALREFLQSDVSNLGAAVGLAAGEAKWSTDHAGNPIVVGRGVVGACRAGDKASAGVIRMTNTAFQSYLDTELSKHTHPLLLASKSKDFPEDVMLRLWELNVEDVLAVILINGSPKAEWGTVNPNWKARKASKVLSCGGNSKFRMS